MSASQQDHTKFGNLMLSMAQQTGRIPSAEDAQKMHEVLDIFAADMQQEDPNGSIYCNCHGEPWRNRDVDIWGNCPWTRGEE